MSKGKVVSVWLDSGMVERMDHAAGAEGRSRSNWLKLKLEGLLSGSNRAVSGPTRVDRKGSPGEGADRFASAVPSPVAVVPKSSPAVVVVPPARNEPCSCGSGRKFKNCCGRGR